MKIFMRFCLVFCAVLLVSTSLFSQGLADTTPLVRPLPILNGKVIMKFPATAVISPRVADIMAADPNVDRETRIIFDVDTMKLVFIAQEIYSLSGDNLYENITREDKPDAGYARKVLLKGDSVVSILTTPSTFDSLSTAILVNSLLVKTPDNTVLKLDAFINPSAYHLKEQYVRLTENIFNSLTKGDRRINLSAKEETYKLTGRAEQLSIKLPKNYVVTVDEKYDFVVYKVSKYTDVMDTTFTSLTLYVGSYPTYFHKEYGFEESNAAKVKGRMMGQDITWLMFQDPAAPFYLKEQFLPLEQVEKGLIMHIASLSNQRKLIDELSAIAESIRITK